jgi:hypothetical protein
MTDQTNTDNGFDLSPMTLEIVVTAFNEPVGRLLASIQSDFDASNSTMSEEDRHTNNLVTVLNGAINASIEHGVKVNTQVFRYAMQMIMEHYNPKAAMLHQLLEVLGVPPESVEYKQ